MSDPYPTPLELLTPEGAAHEMVVIGSGFPPRLAPRAPTGGPADLVVVAPGRDERTRAWTTTAVGSADRAAAAEGTVVVLASPLARRRISRSLERRGFHVAAAFMHLPSFARTLFVVPLHRATLRYVFEDLIASRGLRRPLRRIVARVPPRVLGIAAPSVALWMRRDPSAVVPAWLGVRRAVVQSGAGARPVVHGFDAADEPTVVAKLRPAASSRDNDEIAASAAAAGVDVPTALRRLPLGAVEARVERALGGRPASAHLAGAGDAAVLRFLDDVAAWLERWNAATAGAPLSATRLERETVDRALALEPVLGSVREYVDRLSSLSAKPVGRLVAAHNDLTTWNVLVRERRLGILDWDEAEADGLPLGDFAYAAVDAFTVATSDRAAAFGRCFGGGDVTARIGATLRRLERTAELDEGTAELCLHACWLRHASNEHERRATPTPFLDVVHQILRGRPVRPATPA